MTKDSFLTELWRVYRTEKELRLQFSEVDIKNIENDASGRLLYQVMQQLDCGEWGPFCFAPDFFARLYQVGKGLDPLEYLLREQNYLKDSPKCVPYVLFDYWRDFLKGHRGSRVLILEPLKFWQAGLPALLKEFGDNRFLLIEEKPVVSLILKENLVKNSNVEVLVQNIYAKKIELPDVDVVLGNPFFGKTEDLIRSRHFGMDNLCAFALMNLLKTLGKGVRMQVVVPVNLTFSEEFLPLRQQVSQSAQLNAVWELPTAHEAVNLKLKKLMLEITTGEARKEALLRLGKMTVKGEKLYEKELEILNAGEFLAQESWPLSLNDVKTDKWLKSYQQNKSSKLPLKDALSDIFRGRYLSRKEGQIIEHAEGNYYYINVGDIKGEELDLSQLEPMDLKLELTPAEMTKIQILPGDVLMPCRGTVLKIARAPETFKTLLASANVIVMRGKSGVLDSDYLQLFLESPLGLSLLKTLERGSQSINLNPGDIAALELPLPDINRQRELVMRYQRARGLRDEKLKLIDKEYEDEIDKIITMILG